MPVHQAVRNKHKGAKWESALLTWLQDRGLYATRPRLQGTQDMGDVHVHIDDRLIVLEAKDAQTWLPATWWDEAEAERQHADGDIAAVVIRRRGSTDPARAWVLMPLDRFITTIEGKP